MSTFVVAHGAWSAGWAWKKMHPLLREMGHRLITPTCTGIGERAHLAHAGIDLNTHIKDILGVLQCEDLHDVVLIGHSYGGMVATGVADRVPERIAQIIYLDAFVPKNEQSLLSLQSEENRRHVRESANLTGNGWQVPANPLPPDTSPEDAAWAMPRRVKQPLQTFEQPLQLTGAADSKPKTYIYCQKNGLGDVFRQFANRARSEAGWRYFELDASHNPHITLPFELAVLLDRISTSSANRP